MEVDWLIVGAGLTGLTIAERVAATLGASVLIIDRRDHIAGNAWDAHNADGILEHRYGPHIFHTNSQEVWAYLSRFTRWRPYVHRVLASVEGQLVPLPFNLDSIDRLFPAATARGLTAKLLGRYPAEASVPILKLRRCDDPDLRYLADFVYRNIFERYTIKQWGLSPEELAPSVTARVPVVLSRDDRYFRDTWQAMPLDGYGAMAQRMLASPRIRVLLDTPWAEVRRTVRWRRLVFTGALDEFFDYRYGALPYRTLHFERETLPMEHYQRVAVINYPNAPALTRITEHKWLSGQSHPRTTIVREYPRAHDVGATIPYYPIPTQANRRLYRRYARDAAALGGTVMFAGRLADYMYFNMDQAVARALMLVRKVGDTPA